MEKSAKFVLTQTQEKILKEFAVSPLRKKFYWTGGTALAFFYLGHRSSYDLDFFSDRQFFYNEVSPFVRRLSAKLKLKKISEKKIFDRWDFLLEDGAKTRIEFTRYAFPALRPRRIWGGIQIDSLQDMAANKTMAMIDRKDPKDVFDVYYLIIKKRFTPERLLALVKKKFKSTFPLSLFWSEALLGARDLDSLRPLLEGSKKRQDSIIRKIRTYFENKSAKFVRSQMLE